MARFLLVGGLTSSLVRFRGPLIDAALAAGHEVVCAAGEPDPDTLAALAARGVAFHEIEFERTGTSLLADIRALGALMRLLRRVRPDVVLGYTVKPALYSSLASLVTRIGTPYAMLTGLGYALTPGDGSRTRAGAVAHWLAARVLPRVRRVFFHNHDDRDVCETSGLVRAAQAIVVDGSGVDLASYPSAPLPEGPLTFLFVARLLRDKGIEEFVHAATALHREFPHLRFRVAGEPDETARSVTRAQIEAWRTFTPVEFLGNVTNPWSEYASSHVFVLPSTYGEGLPRTLLEAMAVGRAIITTDMPGCREAVVDDNGLLVAPHDADALLRAMRQCAEHPESVREMGARGLALARSRFDARRVAAAMLRGMDLVERRPRVLHIITGLNTGGAEASLVRVLRATREQVEHTVVSLTSKGTRGAELEAMGIAVHALGLARGAVSVRALGTLRQLVRDLRPDRTQGWMYHGNLAATALAAISRHTGPVLWNVRHALDAWQSESRTLRTLIRLSAWLSWLPSTVVYNSRRAARQHEARGFRHDATRVIPNGVDLTRFSPNRVAGARLRAAEGIPVSAFVVGMIARVDPLKDHDTFFAAIAHSAPIDRDTWYLLAGTDTAAGSASVAGALDARIAALTAAHPTLASRIVRLGERTDIADVLNACDVVTLPSRSEGSPNAVAEAMACGVPCVVTDVGDAAQLVEGSGVVVAVGDAIAIADAWRAFRTDRDDHARRGAHALDTIRRAYSVAHEASQYVAAWRVHRPDAIAASTPAADRPPRVLFVTTTSMTMRAFLLPFADHFRAQGWQVDAAAEGLTADSAASAHFSQVFDLHWSRVPMSPRNWQAVNRIRSLVRDGGYDIVHVHTPVAAFVTRFALRHRPRPTVIYTAHGFHADASVRAWKNLIFRSLERIAGRWTDLLVTINHADLELARRDRLVPVDRLYSHPGIGVDIDRYRPLRADERRTVRAALGIDDAACVIAVVGEFIPRKRQRDILRALVRLERRTTDRPTVLFVGDGPLRSTLEREAAEMGLSGVARFLGHRSDVNEIVAASDALVLCSLREGLPRCVLEAQAMRVPVIGSAAKGTVDLLQGDRGVIVPIGDADALASALLDLRKRPAEARQRALRAQLWVQSHCDLPLLLSLHERLYARALGHESASLAAVAAATAAPSARRVNSAA